MVGADGAGDGRVRTPSAGDVSRRKHATEAHRYHATKAATLLLRAVLFHSCCCVAILCTGGASWVS